MVSIHFEDTDILDVNPEFFGLWMTDICVSKGSSLGELTVIFCSDEYLLIMNREHLNHDYFTDIITFDYTEGLVVSGDLFISIDRVRENANGLGEDFTTERNRVMAHGLLHLLGYGDKSEEESILMRSEENEALALIVSRET
ncbi:MAG: putative rRNA maturation factor [Flavobacteriaceae bacterium]